MIHLSNLLSRLRTAMRRDADADLVEELRFHVEMEAAALERRGLDAPTARREAYRRFGGLDRYLEELRDLRGRRWLDELARDTAFALRTLGRQAGWTATAVLTLALGIGTNTAMFGVADSLLFHPLPYPHSERLAVVLQQPERPSTTGLSITVMPSASTVRVWRENTRTFEDIEAYGGTDMTLLGDAAPGAAGGGAGGFATTIVHAASVLPTFLAFAGQRPLLGRSFTADDVREHARVVMLSEGLWRGRYGSDPAIIGHAITLDDAPYTVIGVAPAALRVPRVLANDTDVWLPLDLSQPDVLLGAVGRLRPGVTAAAAAAELDSISARLEAPGGGRLAVKTRVARPDELVAFRDSLVMLSAAVALVLLIACTNVAHLLLARGAARERELALRAALGASRGRLIRQLLTESLVLAAGGGAGGLALGWVGLRAVAATHPASLSELAAAHLNVRALLVTMAVTTITGIAFGAAGALHVTRRSTEEALKAGPFSTSPGGHRRWLQSLLVASQMALSTALLVGAVLLVRSVVHLQTMDPGFEPRGLYTVQVPLLHATPAESVALAASLQELQQRLRTTPGVQAVTVADAAPPSRRFVAGALQPEGHPPPPTGAVSFISVNGVEPNFFRVLGIRLVDGTTFTDTTAASRQVVINEGLARMYWPGESAVGRRLRFVGFDGRGEWKTIVGVAADARTAGLLAGSSDPMLYVPTPGHFNPTLVVRTASSTARSAVRLLAARIDPILPPPIVTSVADAMAKTIARPRFTMVLLTAFAVLALVLAAVGLYGVMAYTVARQTREIGIRMALGASRSDVARSVLRQGIRLALAGTGIGLAFAAWGTKALQQSLYGVGRTDALSFAIGALVLLGTALLACIVPAQRAVSVDPLAAIRIE